MTLRSELIHLAHSNPAIRHHLLTVLASGELYEMRFKLTTPLLHDEDDAADVDKDLDDGSERSFAKELSDALDLVSGYVNGKKAAGLKVLVTGVSTEGCELTLTIKVESAKEITDLDSENIIKDAKELMEEGIKDAFNSGPIGEWAFHEDSQDIEASIL